jgi:hypothetical protein
MISFQGKLLRSKKGVYVNRDDFMILGKRPGYEVAFERLWKLPSFPKWIDVLEVLMSFFARSVLLFWARLFKEMLSLYLGVKSTGLN